MQTFRGKLINMNKYSKNDISNFKSKELKKI